MEEQKTFAEWLLDYTSTHRDAVVSIEQGQWGIIKVKIHDYSKRPTWISAQYSIMPEIYLTSKGNFDDILIRTAESLNKEIENYGN